MMNVPEVALSYVFLAFQLDRILPSELVADREVDEVDLVRRVLPVELAGRRAAVARHRRVAEVQVLVGEPQAQLLVDPVLQAGADPPLPVERDRRRPLALAQRRGVVGEADRTGPRLRQLVRRAEREAPGVVVVEVRRPVLVRRVRLDLHLAELAPVLPVDVGHHGEPVGQLVVGAGHHLLRHGEAQVDVLAADAAPLQQRGQDRPGADELAGVLELEVDLGGVGDAEAGGGRRLEQDARHAAVADVALLDLEVAVGAGDVRDGGLVVDLAVEDLRPDADREPAVDPVGRGREGAEGQELGLGGVEAAGPVVLVLQRAAEIGAEAEAELQVGGGAVDAVERPARREALRVAAVAAAARVAALVEVADAVGRLDADQDLRPVEPGHAGRVAEGGRGVLGDRRPPRRGRAEVGRPHLVKDEAPGPGVGGREQQGEREASEADRRPQPPAARGGRARRDGVASPHAPSPRFAPANVLAHHYPHFGNRNWTWSRSVQSVPTSDASTLSNAWTDVLTGSLPTRNSRPKPPPTGTVQTFLPCFASQSAVMIGLLARYQPLPRL